ncbi:hypothetical protein [Bacillus norwichensis]|uniref:Uncharacterized protein n=1 Tax=Bacillus norwichensis TaxID=2762217 RepID=A0ABR8VIZ9_9BACI|nr:hypothetical protein [Bacillus norwichensis]MBD8004386.1 hypothetical protein [Bacillus norwichensis]
MEWKQFFSTAAVAAVIVILQWPRMKDSSKRDKGTFIVLILLGLALSLFNLEYLKGPADLEQAIFRPISRLVGR